MKLIIISPLDYTGISYYSHSLSQALSEIGHEVTLITTTQRVAQPAKSGYTVIPIYKKTFGNRSKFIKGFFYLIASVKCAYYLVKEKADAIHFQKTDFPFCDLIPFAVARAFNKRIIYTPHDLGNFYGKIGTAQKILYNVSNRIIVHNDKNKEELKKSDRISEKKIAVIQHGGFEYFLKHSSLEKVQIREKLGFPMNRIILKITGNLSEEKGIFTAISSMRHLSDIPNLCLLISGKPTKNFKISKCVEMIRDLSLAERVIIKQGFIPDNLLEFHFRCSDVVLIPYSTCYESGVLKYAFSCGLPVIVSNLDVFSEYVKDGVNSVIFEAQNDYDLAQKIRTVLSNDALRCEISHGALNTAKTWSWKTIAGDTVNAYVS